MPNNLIAHIAKDFMSGNTEEVADILTFVEAPWGLGINLMPSQRFTLKSFYGMELDDRERNIEVPDVLNEKILYRFTEKQFLDFLYAEGRSNTDSVEGKNFHELVLVYGRRGTKCRAIDDLIPTSVGSLAFSELLNRRRAGEAIAIPTYDPDTLCRQMTTNYEIWDNGVVECFRVKTRRQLQEYSSWNHPYLVWREDEERPRFVDAKDLSVGDMVACSMELPCFGPGDVGRDRASLLGYFIGDGSVTETASFSTASDQQLDDFTGKIEEQFPKHVVKPRGTDESKCLYTVTKESGRRKQDGTQKNMVWEWLKDTGVAGCSSYEKRVPDCIMRGSRDEVSSFLSRLFACDGHASVEAVVYESHSNVKSHIGYASVSYDLCQDVRHLLLKFGVHCTIGPTTVTCNGKRFTAWMLRICRTESVLRFASEIGIFTKEDDVGAVVAAQDGKGPSSDMFDCLPRGVWNRIRRLRDEKGMTNTDIAGQDGRLRMRYAPSKSKAEVYGANLGDQFLIDMARSDVYWDMVEEVEPAGRMPTVDLSVPGTHIIGGELLSHNSTMASCISNYELYKLVKRGDPSKFFGFPANTIISILNVAPTDDQAGQVFDMIQNQALKCPYLRDRSLHQTMTYFDIQTDADQKMHGKPRASLVSVAGGCSSNSLRGRNAIVVIMDEMAFFIDKDNSRFSGAEVYKALTPSMTDFGEHGKVLCLSSPYGKFGRFYERFQESFEEPDYTLMFKMYTAMANPRVPTEILRAAYRRDKTGFMSEYGGEFSDRVTAWIELETEFRKNIYDRPVVTRGARETQYFMGIDLGFKNDGTAIAVVHKEGSKIVLDYADVWFGSQSDVWEMSDSIYHGCTKYRDRPLLKMADIVQEIKELSRWFGIKSGLFDQAGGWGFLELLTGAGFKQIEMKHFTDTLNHDVYQLTKRLYGEQLLDLYEHPVLVPEMLSLEAEKQARGKVKVKAPNREGAHDDISDAFVRAVWACYNASKGRPSHIATGAGGQAGVTGRLRKGPAGEQGPKAMTQQQAMLQKRKKHGEHPRGLDRLKRRRPGAVRR